MQLPSRPALLLLLPLLFASLRSVAAAQPNLAGIAQKALDRMVFGKPDAVHAPEEGKACLLFTLTGVDQGDPDVPGRWLAVSAAHAGYKEIAALVITAFATDRDVYAVTTGKSICGAAEVAKLEVR